MPSPAPSPKTQVAHPSICPSVSQSVSALLLSIASLSLRVYIYIHTLTTVVSVHCHHYCDTHTRLTENGSPPLPVCSLTQGLLFRSVCRRPSVCLFVLGRGLVLSALGVEENKGGRQKVAQLPQMPFSKSVLRSPKKF